jgi:deoxyribonucleoside regulator
MADTVTPRLIRAARLYYLYNLSQQQIADKLKISRPGVSRLLQEARDRGIVKIEIIDPAGSGADLERRLERRYRLKKAVVVPNEGAPDDAALKARLGAAAARFLDSCAREGMTLGVSWGTTMQELAGRLRPRRLRDSTVVQLVGGIARAVYDTHASEIVQKVADTYRAMPYLLPVPAIVDKVRVKEALMSDRHIAEVLELGRRAEIAVFSVGRLSHGCLMCRAEYFRRHQVDALLQDGAVGDIINRIVTGTGEVCSPDLDARTVGVELDDLKRKKYSVVVAGSPAKLPVLRACLLGRYCNVLITDEETALALANDPEPGQEGNWYAES